MKGASQFGRAAAERCARVNAGDAGQRYEVRYNDGAGSVLVFGSVGTVEGARKMVDAVNENPRWSDPFIKDRKTGGIVK